MFFLSVLPSGRTNVFTIVVSKWLYESDTTTETYRRQFTRQSHNSHRKVSQQINILKPSLQQRTKTNSRKQLHFFRNGLTVPQHNHQSSAGRRAFSVAAPSVRNSLADYRPNSTWLVTYRYDTFDASSPCILAVSSLSNSTARLATRSTRRARLAEHVERVVSYRNVTWRDQPSGIWAYLHDPALELNSFRRQLDICLHNVRTERIRDIMTMCYMNLLFTYLLTYLYNNNGCLA